MGKLTHNGFMNAMAITRRIAPPGALLLALGLALALPVHAQSATNFNTQKITPKASPSKKEKSAPQPSKETGPVSATPSRYVGEADLDAYVASLSAVLSMRGRETDPFGQLQDPDAKPVIKTTVAKATRRVAPVQATPFSDIIRLIEVKIIMPGEKRFYVGTRSIKQGESLTLAFRGRNVRAEVTSVTSRQIDFRNLESGETGSLKINLLPVGMTPGTKGITAPGMVPDRANAPIELEPASNPSEDNPQNR